MNVVLDTNVVVSAIFWPGESRDCLVAWAKKKYQLAATLDILNEYCEVARRLARKFPEVNPEPWLEWLGNKGKFYEPAPLGRQRSRDPKDDPFLACALACGAKIIVSKDKDLLDLGKPFGVEVLTPREFVARLRRSS
jgi:putative PIN family toxin of toxin-antitoxin system